MKLRRPVMGDDEAKAAVQGLKALKNLNILVPEDKDKIAHVIEAIECAPAIDGDKIELDPAATQIGSVGKTSTSRAAAIANYPRSGTQRARVLAVVHAAPSGRTREELADQLRLPENSVRPRVRELIDGGWLMVLMSDDKPVTRKSTLGNDSEVLVVTAKTRQRVAAARTPRARRSPVTA